MRRGRKKESSIEESCLSEERKIYLSISVSISVSISISMKRSEWIRRERKRKYNEQEHAFAKNQYQTSSTDWFSCGCASFAFSLTTLDKPSGTALYLLSTLCVCVCEIGNIEGFVKFIDLKITQSEWTSVCLTSVKSRVFEFLAQAGKIHKEKEKQSMKSAGSEHGGHASFAWRLWVRIWMLGILYDFFFDPLNLRNVVQSFTDSEVGMPIRWQILRQFAEPQVSESRKALVEKENTPGRQRWTPRGQRRILAPIARKQRRTPRNAGQTRRLAGSLPSRTSRKPRKSGESIPPSLRKRPRTSVLFRQHRQRPFTHFLSESECSVSSTFHSLLQFRLTATWFPRLVYVPKRSAGQIRLISRYVYFSIVSNFS